MQVALGLKETFESLAKTAQPTAKQLLEGTEPLMVPERLGEVLIGLGVLALVTSGIRLARTARGVAILATILALLAPIAAVAFPTVRIPALLTVQPPPDEWPEGAVAQDRSAWNAFVLISKKREWAVTFEGSELGPQGLEPLLAKRLAKEKRRVHLFVDPRCPKETRQIFSDSASRVAQAAGVEVVEDSLPNPEDFQAIRKRIRQGQLEPFRETVLVVSLARFAAALALALVVWWTEGRARRGRGLSIVTAAYLVVAFGLILSVPLGLYAGVLPDGSSSGRSAFVKIAQNILPHVAFLILSAGAVMSGGIAAAVGHWLADEPPPPDKPRVPLRAPLRAPLLSPAGAAPPASAGPASPASGEPASLAAGEPVSPAAGAPSPGVPGTEPADAVPTSPAPASLAPLAPSSSAPEASSPPLPPA